LNKKNQGFRKMRKVRRHSVKSHGERTVFVGRRTAFTDAVDRVKEKRGRPTFERKRGEAF